MPVLGNIRERVEVEKGELGNLCVEKEEWSFAKEKEKENIYKSLKGLSGKSLGSHDEEAKQEEKNVSWATSCFGKLGPTSELSLSSQDMDQHVDRPLQREQEATWENLKQVKTAF